MFYKIKGYNYGVNKNGDVKNFKSGRILKPQKNSQGYLQVCLCKNGLKYYPLVHRLVMMNCVEFDPETQGYLQVDHIDNDKTNNKLENLRWCTPDRFGRNPNNSKRKIFSTNTTGAPGVSWHEQSNKWHVTITIDSKSKDFYCDDLEDAKILRRSLVQAKNPDYVSQTETEPVSPEDLAEVIAKLSNKMQIKIKAILLF